MRVQITALVTIIGCASPALAQPVNPAGGVYSTQCARCRGSDGTGGEIGRSIVNAVSTRSDACDGKQHVAVASGGSIIAFGLVEGGERRGRRAGSSRPAAPQIHAMQSISTSELPGMPPAAAMVVRTPG